MENLALRAREMDEVDALAPFRNRFHLDEGVIYLDGNSLGPMLKTVPERLARAVEQEWASGLIRSWNTADWVSLPERVGARIARLIGANPNCVTATDSTSVNLFKLLAAALELNKGRMGIVGERGNFPTDLYIAEGVQRFLDKGHTLHWAENDEEIYSLITEETAVVVLTQVDFRTGRLLDMEKITAHAHDQGALVIWDLCHTAGALPVELDKTNADFAVGCTYKYLNGGPGSPAYVYVNERHLGKVQQPLSGWFSHRSPFDFEPEYAPADTIRHFLCGTPSVLSLTVLEESLTIWEEVSLDAIRAKSLDLTDFFIECIEDFGLDDWFVAVTPIAHGNRGSQVSLAHEGDGYAVMQALISKGVIGDFRAPNILRFGFAPLYNGFEDVYCAVKILNDIMETDEWKKQEFRTRNPVT